MPCHQLPPWPVPTVILLESGGVALEVLAVVGRFRASLDIGINRGLKSSVVTVALGAACHHALVRKRSRDHHALATPGLAVGRRRRHETCTSL